MWRRPLIFNGWFMKFLLPIVAFATCFLIAATGMAEQAQVTVKGMVCSFCAQGIKKTILRKPSVESVEVDLDKKVVTVTTKKGEGLSDEELKEAIVDSGFEVVRIERVS